METRSRKRAEAATTQSPSPLPNKRARFSTPLHRSPHPPCDRLRPIVSRFQEVSMDSPFSSSASKHMTKELDKDEGSDEHLRKATSRMMDRDKESSEKGKEKEPQRRNDGERPPPPGSDDEHHDVDGNSSLHHNFASASTALHGLLRKLGASLDDLLPSSSPHQSSKLKRILSNLRADGEEGKQLEALTQLCEMLSIGTEESLSSFSVDSFVPVLVGLLNHEYNPDMMLLAARALTHLCDVLPSSCAAVVHYGAVPCLCARLLTIEYIDLAEQSLQALEKISHEHPAACLRAGALLAVLSYLDFFSTGVQRVAVSTAANICRQLPSDASDFLKETVPILTNLLQYQDPKVVDHASVCLSRISESFASSPEKLDMLCAHGLIAQVVRLISVSLSNGAIQTPLSNSTYTGLVRLLSTCASGSASAAESLLLSNISSILKEVLAGSGSVSSLSIAPASVSRPPEQLYELITLVNELLPPIPQPSALASSTTLSRITSRRQTGSSSSKNDVGTHVSAREKLLEDHPDLLLQFGTDLIPILMQVYGSSVNPPLRHKCLAAMSKLVHFSTAEMLWSLLKDLNISSFLAGVLGLKDPSMLLIALQIAETLMQKLPDVFTRLFVKEGVVHAVDKLIACDHGNAAFQPSSYSGRNVETSGALHDGMTPVRPRRGSRRRSGGSEASLEEQKNFPMGSPPSGGVDAATQMSRTGLRSLAISSAKHFKEAYFSTDLRITDVSATESLSKLKALCAKLNGENMLVAKGKWKGKGKAAGAAWSASDELMLGVLADILAELSRGDGVSTFEFIGSGIVESLLSFFSGGSHGRDSLSDAKLRQQTFDRMKQFIALGIPADVDGKEAPVTVLIRKLQDALASLERFPVILSHTPRSGTGNSSVAAGLSALAQPFKLRLCRALGERGLREYSSNIVLIDPLATLSSIEEFLWSRVQRSESAQKPSAIGGSLEGSGALCPASSVPASKPATRSKSYAAVSSEAPSATIENPTSSSLSKGKGKVGAQNANEVTGPETRNAAARRRAAVATASAPASKVQKDLGTSGGSEDEDVEISPVEVDEPMAIDDDLSDDDEDEQHDEVFGEEPTSVSVGEAVHSVRLDDGTAGSGASTSGNVLSKPSSGLAGVNLGGRGTLLTGGLDANELRIGSSAASRNSLSFAAAAMAGLSSSSGRGLHAGRDHNSLTSSRSSFHNATPRLAFSLGGKPLNRSWTIFQAVQRHTIADEDDDERLTGTDYSSGEGKRLWDEIYTIHYQRIETPSEQGVVEASTSSSLSANPNGKIAASVGSNDESPRIEGSWQLSSLLDSILLGELPCDLDKDNPTYSILVLLRLLHGLNQLAPLLRTQAVSDAYTNGRIARTQDMRLIGPLVHQEEFLSGKLTPKLARQMQDALALCSGGLPAWCCQLTKACPFLFPFETRRQYFYSTALGLSRALQRLQQQQSMDNANSLNERELRIGRLQRQKVRVSRNRILESAAKVMELYSGHRSVLEVEYFGEVGTGLGPTLEFYTLLSRDLQKLSLNMWRTSTPACGVDDFAISGDDVDMQDAASEALDESLTGGDEQGLQEGEYVHAPYGLFPRPWPPILEGSRDSRHTKVIEHFRLLGRAMGKALQDGRLLDLPLSTAFYKLMLGQELDLHDVKLVDPELGESLQEMQDIVWRKQFLESCNKRQEAQALRLHDTRIEDLCLDFSLPGYPEYELRLQGQNLRVNLDNLEDYVALVVNATVKSGIAPQIEAFRAGFNQVFQISSLQLFNEEELDYLLCGCREVWTAETLVEHMKFDHGYTASSPPIRNLLEIMGEFTPEQQRAFLRFVTGAPRLPSGGLAALSPKLTIVRKHPTGSSGAAALLGSTPPGAASAFGTPLADGDLPSVMTCANYLKLPPYSCKEVMRERLLFAISEGQGSFDLS